MLLVYLLTWGLALLFLIDYIAWFTALGGALYLLGWPLLLVIGLGSLFWPGTLDVGVAWFEERTGRQLMPAADRVSAGDGGDESSAAAESAVPDRWSAGLIAAIHVTAVFVYTAARLTDLLLNGV